MDRRSKVARVEAALGIDLTRYFRTAGDRGITQEEMAMELSSLVPGLTVTRVTVNYWLRERVEKTYRAKRNRVVA